ncbi:hypothetical protein ACQ33O_10260 [Ferruginibacter sp. SUN002]|uniref:hypothetical protein n=1 Tax=Ferruginibacter sp. SUN002 TaxID=2937789 RepID=UPI003D367833
MRFYLIISLCILLISCNNNIKPWESTEEKKNASPPVVFNRLTEDKIVDTLMKLPFIIKANAHIDSVTDHLDAISFIIDTLRSGESDIHVKAGYNAEDRYFTYYQFYVDPKTFDIKVYDPVADVKTPLVKYLEAQK